MVSGEFGADDRIMFVLYCKTNRMGSQLSRSIYVIQLINVPTEFRIVIMEFAVANILLTLLLEVVVQKAIK